MSLFESISVSREDYLLLYRLLARTRALEEVLVIHAPEIPGPTLTGLGQEIVPVASLFSLMKLGILKDSIKNPDHRTVYGVASVIDEDTKNIFATADLLRNYFARATGGNKGRDGNVHWCYLKEKILGLMCSDMGRAPGIAVGMAEEMRRTIWPGLPKKKRPVCISFFGDGAAQQGGVHEAMNWTSASNCRRSKTELARIDETFLDDIVKETRVLRGAPVIFIINNNQLALFADAGDEHGRSNLSARANGYGNMVGVDVDGMDPVALFNETVKAVERAQSLRSTLIVAHTYRLTGHNETQVRRNPQAVGRGDFFDVEHVFGLHTKEQKEEFKKWVEKEPVFHGWSNWLVDTGYATRAELNAVVEEERARIRTLFEQILSEPKITVFEHKKDLSVFPPFPKPIEPRGETKRMNYLFSFSFAVSQLKKEDNRVTYCGQDVATLEGGVLGFTRGLLKEFGPRRIHHAPISEEAIIANAAGRALMGGKPVVEMEFSPFFWDGGAVLAHATAPQWFQKKMKHPFILILPSGTVHKGGSGHYHESWPERFLIGMEGIVIVAPANAYEVAGLLRSAYLYDGPTAILLQISAGSLSEFESLVPLEPYSIPLGEAHIEKEGADITIVTYGAATVAAAKNEAENLLKESISVEVINLRTVHPWDFGTIKQSVLKTKRCIIFHEDYTEHGVGRMLAGRLIADQDVFDAHVRFEVLGASEMFIPNDLDLLRNRLPYERIGEGKETKHVSPKLSSLVKEMMRGGSRELVCGKGAAQKTGGPLIELKPSLEWLAVAKNLVAGPSTSSVVHAAMRVDFKDIFSALKNMREREGFSGVGIAEILEYGVAQTLKEKEFSTLNGFWKESQVGDEKRVVLYPHVHLGIAYDRSTPPHFDLETLKVSGERLRIPTIFSVDDMSFEEFLDARKGLMIGAARGKLLLSEMEGYTCIFNNIGALGFESGNSIVPRGISLVLNLGFIDVDKKGYIGINFDHRMCDGARAAAFIKAALERARVIATTQ